MLYEYVHRGIGARAIPGKRTGGGRAQGRLRHRDRRCLNLGVGVAPFPRQRGRCAAAHHVQRQAEPRHQRRLLRALTTANPTAGFTLIEALIAMVVLAAAATGVLLIFANATAASADPQIRVQARSIAEAYMDEILLQPYADPNGGETGGVEAGEVRASYDDVWDYDAIGTESPTDQLGNPIAGLGAYTVVVAVGGSHDTDPGAVSVRVRHTSDRVDYRLASERHEY